MTSFRTLRKQLDDLGYYQPLVIDAVPLVEALLHDLLTTTSSLKICKESNSNKDNYHLQDSPESEIRKDSKPNAFSTPIANNTSPLETNSKIICLQNRVTDLENLNKECNHIIQRQQIELDEKSKRILKLELSIGAPKAKVITQYERPLIISDSLKPRIEMTRFIQPPGKDKFSNQQQDNILGGNKPEYLQSDIDLVKMYEKRNQHLDQELARLQKELEKALKLLSQAEKQWRFDTRNEKHLSPQVSDLEHLQTPEGHKSNYMIKLLNDNNQMKAKLAEINSHSKLCFHGKAIPPTSTAPYIYNSENVRSAVESSHAQLRQSVSIKSRPRNSNPIVPDSFIEGKENHYANSAKKNMDLTEANFKHIKGINQELTRQIKELNCQKTNLKEKLEHVETQLNILISKSATTEGGNASKIQELITYIEAQRDIYKNNVERLLNKLDPERTSKLSQDAEGIRVIEEEYQNCNKYAKGGLKNNRFSANKLNSNIYSKSRTNRSFQAPSRLDDVAQTSPSTQKNVENVEQIFPVNDNSKSNKVDPIQNEKYPSDFLVDASTKENIDNILEEIIRGNNNISNEKHELKKAKAKITELENQIEKLSASFSKKLQLKDKELEGNMTQNDIHSKCQEEKQTLDDVIVRLQNEIDELKLHDSLRQNKSRQQISDIRDTTDNTLEAFQKDLRTYQNEIDRLKSDVSLKEKHLHEISKEKDALQNQLDEKTIQHEDLKSKYRNERSQLDRLTASKSGHEQQIQHCLSEITQLQLRNKDAEKDLQNSKSRLDAEKSLNRDIGRENMKLKQDLSQISTESEIKDGEIKDLRANVNSYVSEVKRIEELLSSRERERSKLLEQYRYLSDEVDKSELYGRDLEAKVSHLKLELSTRSTELKATESRLADMEQDLIELSLSNESYRSQVVMLTSNFDLVDTELRAAKSQTIWGDTEFADVQQLANQLDEEKSGLQRQISDQAQEIESLNGEILSLRLELSNLTKQMEEDKPYEEQKRQLNNKTDNQKDRI